MFNGELKAAFMSVSEVSLPLAAVRDEYLTLKGGESRFMQLAEAYSNLNTIEQSLFEYLQIKPSLFGKKPDREVLMMTEASLKNAKLLLELATSEVALLRKIN